MPVTVAADKFPSRRSLVQLFLGGVVGWAALSLAPLLVLAYLGLFAVLLGLSKRNLAIVMALVLPIAALTNFSDVEVIHLPMFDSFGNIYLMMNVGLLYLCILKGKLAQWDFEPVLPFVPFFILALLASLFSTSPGKSYLFFATNYIPIALYAVAWYSMIRYPENRRYFHVFFCLTVCAMFVVSLYQYQTNGFWFTTPYRQLDNLNELYNMGADIRVPSLFKDPFGLIQFTMFGFPFVLAAYQTAKKRVHKGIAAAVLFMLLVVTVLSKQRTGLVVLLLQFSMAYFLTHGFSLDRKSMARLFKFFGGAALLLFLFVQTEYGAALVTRIVGTFINPTEYARDAGSTLVRLRRVQIAWNIFQAYPTFGCGLGTSPEMFDRFGWEFKNSTGGPHNLYLFLLSETGIFTFLAFFWAWARLFRKFLAARRLADPMTKPAAVAGLSFCVTVLLDGIFSGLMVGTGLLLFFVGLTYALAALHTKKEAVRPGPAGQAPAPG